MIRRITAHTNKAFRCVQTFCLSRFSPYSRIMRGIHVLVGLTALLLFLPAHAGHSPPNIILQIFVQTGGQGMSSTQATTIALPPRGEVIQIRALPEITEHELIDAQADASGAVHLRFNHIGQVVLSAFTAQNQDRIMVIMLNGYVIYAPIIDEQITTGELIIPHPIKPEALQALQETARRNVEKAGKS